MPVSAKAVEWVFRDIESHVHFVPHLREVQVLPSHPQYKGQAQVGTQWREVLVFRGKAHTHYKTITHLTTTDRSSPKGDNDAPDVAHFSMTISVDFRERQRWDNRDASETYSVEVRPLHANGDDSCIVIWTFAFVPGGMANALKVAFERLGQCSQIFGWNVVRVRIELL